METVLVVLTVLISVLLIIIVLIQKSKGGGLSSSFAGSNQIMGVRRTTDFVEKATWTLAIIIMVLAVIATLMASSHSGKGNAGEVAPNQAPIEQAEAINYSSDAPAAVAEEVEAVAVTEEAAPVAAETPAN